MENQKNVTISPNAIGYKSKSIKRIDVYEIEYKEPKSIVGAIFSNLFKYLIFMLFLIGIPFAIMAIVRDIKNHRIIITLKLFDRKGKREIVTWYVSKEEYDYIRENY